MKALLRIMFGMVLGTLVGVAVGGVTVWFYSTVLEPDRKSIAQMGRGLVQIVLFVQCVVCCGLGGATGRIALGSAVGGCVVFCFFLGVLYLSNAWKHVNVVEFLGMPTAGGFVTGAVGGFAGRCGYRLIPKRKPKNKRRAAIPLDEDAFETAVRVPVRRMTSRDR